MTEVPDRLLTLYSAEIDTTGDEYTITVPKREVKMGDVDPEAALQVGLFDKEGKSDTDPSPDQEPSKNGRSGSNRRQAEVDRRAKEYDNSGPPVEKGEIVEVEIESLGDKGDGIARVDKGYVIIIPDTDVGEQVSARLNKIKENVGFAEVVKRHQQPVA